MQAELDTTASDTEPADTRPGDRGDEVRGGSAEPPHPHTDPAGHRPRRPAERAELATRAVEHTPGPVLEPLAARRLDALLDLITGDYHADPATLVVHLRLDHPDPAPTASANPGPHLQVLTCSFTAR